MTRFLQDDALQGVRHQFFEGELPQRQQQQFNNNNNHGQQAIREPQTAHEMLFRIDSRLRRVVKKACTNSLPAARVVKTFETFVIESFAANNNKTKKSQKKQPTTPSSLDDDWFHNLLLEQPTVTQRKDNDKYTAQFHFPAQTATGGFHRLLLHAVCQFHGLSAVSRTLKLALSSNAGDEETPTQSRALLVTGPPVVGKFRLLTVLTGADDDPNQEVEELGTKLEGWTMV
mmetsp:Transcript_19816/g.42686  ORF Transcript_19816/g.42686 Transcript_19816/m.42686 type:complete len:230 (+) Transcript_19816:786-1475(+)